MHTPIKAIAFTKLMSTVRMRAIVVPAALLMSACATQPTLRPTPAVPAPVSVADQTALRSMVAQQDRLYRVVSPLLVRNAELCRGHARNLLGFTAKNKYSYSAELAPAAQSMLGLDEHLQVTNILRGSGAEKAGLRRGDKLISIEGTPVPAGENADRNAALMLAPLVAPTAGLSSLGMSVIRNNASLPLNIQMTRACAYSIELGNTDVVNAYSDGRRVMVTRGMMNFAQSDEELSYVLAKEIAHNALQHASRLNISATVSDIMDNLVRLHPDMRSMGGMSGVKPMPRDMDGEADRLALYMVQRAGYPVGPAVRFWEKLATRYPPAVLNAYTAIHPDTAYRLSVLKSTTAEIRSKQASGAPLMP